MKKIVQPVEVSAEETVFAKTVKEFDDWVEKDRQGLASIKAINFSFKERLLSLDDVTSAIESIFEPSYLNRVYCNQDLIEEITEELARVSREFRTPPSKYFNWPEGEEEREKLLQVCRPFFDGRTHCSIAIKTPPEKLLKYHQDMAEYLSFVKNNQ